MRNTELVKKNHKIKQIVIIIVFTFLSFGYAKSQTPNIVSETQKEDFIKTIKTLPHKGEFFTEEGINRAAGSLPILFAFTEEDLSDFDIYPFIVLSAGLADRKCQQDYAIEHFSEIKHPTLKLSWGALLFNKRIKSPEIVNYLKDALKSEKQSKILSEMLGANYKNFQLMLNESSVKK